MKQRFYCVQLSPEGEAAIGRSRCFVFAFPSEQERDAAVESEEGMRPVAPGQRVLVLETRETKAVREIE